MMAERAIHGNGGGQDLVVAVGVAFGFASCLPTAPLKRGFEVRWAVSSVPLRGRGYGHPKGTQQSELIMPNTNEWARAAVRRILDSAVGVGLAFVVGPRVQKEG